MVHAESVSVSDLLEGDVDADAKARAIPDTFVAKGMFFSRHVQQLGAGWEEAQKDLSAPPRFGRYLPFVDYPQSDYVRIIAATAAKVYPRVGLCEGLRRLAREDFNVFAESTLGKVVLSVVGDARSALLKIPLVYSKMAPGDWEVSARDVDDGIVRIEFNPLYGSWEYVVGQLEGVVLYYSGSPRTTVTEPAEYHLCFDVRHSP